MGVNIKHQEDARLELIRSIREQSRYNSELMNSRHRILAEETPAEQPERADASAGFKLRFFIAVLLFVGFSWLNFTGRTFLSQSAGDYVETISRDVDMKAFDFTAAPFFSEN